MNKQNSSASLAQNCLLAAALSTDEGNKLIAESLGMQKGHPDKNESRWKNDWFEKLVVDGNDFEAGRRHSEPLKFRSSWEWLMSVVEWIETLSINEKYHSFFVSIGKFKTSIISKDKLYNPNFSEEIFSEHPNKKERTYQAVVQFCLWYLENKVASK